MSRGTVYQTPQARLDLIDAALTIAEDNPSAADRFLDAITKTIGRLAKHPMIGRARPELAPDLRSFPHRQYVIFYRRSIPQGVEVVRVLHGARDIPPLFEDL
jgi:toxin ParE1/3/4